MKDLQIAGNLRAAANYLRTNGWNQGGFGRPGESRCMAGAILSVTGTICSTVDRGHFRALGFIGKHWETEGEVGEWNDQPWRTFDEVLDRLESTALALEVRALAAEAASKPPESAAFRSTPELVTSSIEVNK